VVACNGRFPPRHRLDALKDALPRLAFAAIVTSVAAPWAFASLPGPFPPLESSIGPVDETSAPRHGESPVRSACDHRVDLAQHCSEREWQHYTAYLRRNQRGATGSHVTSW
jgi:hypothetical protein